MKLLGAYNKIVTLPTAVFSTQDFSIIANVTNKHGNQMLTRLAAEDLIIHLRRGLWAKKDAFDPLILPEFLTAPFPSYISLQTALYFHGIVSQIASNIYAISLARTKTYDTPVGVYSIHHIQPSLFTGFESIGDQYIKMATPEKALFDFFYLKAAKNNLFYALPEIEISRKFKWSIVRSYCDAIDNISRRNMVLALIAKKNS